MTYPGAQGMWDCDLECDLSDMVIRSRDDLQLAAELGKALLERNRELEAQLQQQQQSYQEQNMELQHVSKQLETLRTMTESRNRVYEEVDRISQDLERQNQKLNMDAKADRQKIDRQTHSVEHLEQKVDELHKKLEEAKKTLDKAGGGLSKKQEKRRTASLASLDRNTTDGNNKKQEKRRTASLASLDRNTTDGNKSDFYLGDLAWTKTSQFKKMPLNPWEAELLKLQESLQHIKTQWTIERRKREDLEVDLDVCEQENTSLVKKVTILEERLSEAMLLEYELEQARQSPEGVCRSCRKVMDIHEELHAPEAELLLELEHDAPTLLSQARAVKLEGGGSLYGSSESINKVSADAREIEESKSILDELETQYKSLFQKYESLIQNKSKRLSQTMQTDDETTEERAIRRRLAHKEVQTLLHMTLNRDYFQESCQPPPYKALFKDLFATLRKTSIDESQEHDKGATTPGDTPSASPSMDFAKALTSSPSLEFSRVAQGLSDLSKGLTSPVAAPAAAAPSGFSLAQRIAGGEKGGREAGKEKEKGGREAGKGKEKGGRDAGKEKEKGREAGKGKEKEKGKESEKETKDKVKKVSKASGSDSSCQTGGGGGGGGGERGRSKSMKEEVYES